MNPFDKVKSQINENLHNNLPKKWKKIGDILVADFSQIDKTELSHVSQVYADVLNVKTVLQKNRINYLLNNCFSYLNIKFMKL